MKYLNMMILVAALLPFTGNAIHTDIDYPSKEVEGRYLTFEYEIKREGKSIQFSLTFSEAPGNEKWAEWNVLSKFTFGQLDLINKSGKIATVEMHGDSFYLDSVNFRFELEEELVEKSEFTLRMYPFSKESQRKHLAKKWKIGKIGEIDSESSGPPFPPMHGVNYVIKLKKLVEKEKKTNLKP